MTNNVSLVSPYAIQVKSTSAYSGQQLAIDFYYKSYPSLIIGVILLLLQIRVEIYNTLSFRVQSRKSSASDVKYMIMPIVFALPLFMDATYDMISNLDESQRSLLMIIIFAAVEGVLFLTCLILVKVGQLYLGGNILRISKSDGYNLVSMEEDGGEGDEDDEGEAKPLYTRSYKKYNGYYKLNFTSGCLVYAFISCITFVVKAISVHVFEDVLTDNIMVGYTFTLLGILFIMMLADFFYLNRKFTRVIYTPYLVMFAYGCAILMDYHNKRRSVDIVMIFYSILALGASTVKLSQIVEIDIKKDL